MKITYYSAKQRFAAKYEANITSPKRKRRDIPPPLRSGLVTVGACNNTRSGLALYHLGTGLVVIAFALLFSSGCTGIRPRAKASPVPYGTGQEVTKKIVLSGGKNFVRSIEFFGNHTYKDNALKKKLGFEEDDYLDNVLAENGRAIIEEYYKKKGFAYVRVMLNTAKIAEGQVIYIIDEGPRVRIKSVRFKGNNGIKTRELRKTIKTKTRRWLIRPAYYTEEKVAADIEKLRMVYYRRGYLNHKIRALGESNITFIIEEGPVYKVGSIILNGNTEFEQARLLAGLELAPGQIYYQQKAKAHARRILRIYRENGFVDATVEHRADFVDGEVAFIANVVFEIIEGKQFRIGRVDITGNEQTHDKVIRRVLDEHNFSPGKLYNADMAPKEGGGKLEEYVQRMTLAERAIITPSRLAAEPNRMDASVDIKEALTGMWSPGFAVGSNSGVIGNLIWEQRNFNIKDRPESFSEFITMKAFKGAGQTLRISLQPGTIVSQYSVAFIEPFFRDKPTSLDIGGSSYERLMESYDEERLRGYLGFEQRRENNWRRSIRFRAENVDVEGLDTDAPREIKNVKGGNMLAGVKLGIGRDMTDDKFNPSTGYIFNTNYEQVGGDHNFGILSGVYTRYTTLYEDLLERKTVLATKLRAGTTVGDAPPFEKFYGGGTGTYGLRGFEYRGVSARGLQTNVANPKRKDPIGSDWIFLANAEVAVPMVGESLSWLFFVDSGAIDSGGYRAAVGTGVQIMIPQLFGPAPMRFEIATPLMKEDEDDTQAFSFSIGGLFF